MGFALDEPIVAKLVLCQLDFGLLPDLPALNELRAIDRWVAWRYRERDGKLTKPPVDPRTGRMANVSDAGTWGTFAEAAKRVLDDALPGVGFVLTEDDDLTGYDLDKCVDEETGEIEPWAQEIIALAETYAEISPSGRGIRLWGRGKIEATAKNDKAQVEMYRAGRFLTVTGRHIETTPDEIGPAPRTLEALRARLAAFAPKEEPRQKAPERQVSAPVASVPASDGDFFRAVNDAAFANLDPWVQAMFPMARRQASTRGYRITSKQLGRNLQEDLAITPKGAEDFGLEEKRTAIDLVVEYGFADSVSDAALWLCEKIGADPKALGYRDAQEERDRLDAMGAQIVARMEAWSRQQDGSFFNSETGEVAAAPPDLGIVPTPWVSLDPKKIPKREWLYGHHLIRQFLSATVAPGGLGKSSQSLMEAICLATGRNLLGERVYQRCRVWYFNGEDPPEELQRRIVAACLYYGIDQSELEGWLFVDSGRSTRIVIAEEDRNGVKINRPLIAKLEAAIRLYEIDAAVFDPFVKTHRVSENDNTKIDMVCEQLALLAGRCNIAVDLVHHVRKSNDAKSGNLSVDDARGAGALLGAVRSARVLNRMSEDEAAQLNIKPAERLRLFRVDNGKSNLAPPSDQALWRELVSVSLGNGFVSDLVDESDHVAVVTSYTPVRPTEITDEQVQDIRSRCMLGEHRYDIRAQMWIGKVLADVLGLDPTINEVRQAMRDLVEVGLKDGWLEKVEAPDEKRNLRVFIKAGARDRA